MNCICGTWAGFWLDIYRGKRLVSLHLFVSKTEVCLVKRQFSALRIFTKPL